MREVGPRRSQPATVAPADMAGGPPRAQLADAALHDSLTTLSRRKRKSILRIAAKVRARKLAAVATLVPSLVAWIRRVRRSSVLRLPAWVKEWKERESRLALKRSSADEPTTLEGRSSGSTAAELQVGPSGAKRRTRPPSPLIPPLGGTASRPATPLEQCFVRGSLFSDSGC